MNWQEQTFEFHDPFPVDRKLLQTYLQAIWKQQKIVEDETLDDSNDTKNVQSYQGFLKFDGDTARAKNYVGFVQSEDTHIEIYPKVFKGISLNKTNVNLILRHIFLWLDYCRKWRFPFNHANLDVHSYSDFPELIIKLIADQLFNTITQTPLTLFEEAQESLMTPRGKINFTRYIANGFSNGNQHILECDHEPSTYDNTLNRIIKYVARQLKVKARFNETQSRLNEILFVLDDVSDVLCTSSNLDTVRLNPFFSDYQQVKEMCRYVLDQEIYSNNHYQQSYWSLLLPMEYIFEDFVAGFLEKHFSADWDVHYQASDEYLVREPQSAFLMKHDIFLISKHGTPRKKIIIDTKYKIRAQELKDDPKRGISQSDLYQVMSYAFRRGCNKVMILYPNVDETYFRKDHFKIESPFTPGTPVRVIAADIPFWSLESFKKLEINLLNQFINLLSDKFEN